MIWFYSSHIVPFIDSSLFSLLVFYVVLIKQFHLHLFDMKVAYLEIQMVDHNVSVHSTFESGTN